MEFWSHDPHPLKYKLRALCKRWMGRWKLPSGKYCARSSWF